MESKSEILLSSDEEKLIEKFKVTYNATYIQNLSDEKKQYASKDNVVLQRLVNNLQVPPVNPQYIEGPHSFYRLSLLSNKTFYLFGESHIDTRGHCHDLPQSMVFHEYIKQLSKNTHSFIDLYLELPMLNPTKPVDKDNLSHYDVDITKTISTDFAIVDTISDMYNYDIDFESTFQTKIRQPRILRPGFIIESLFNNYIECIQPSSRHAENCQLMRIHNIDIRSNWSYNMPSHLQFYLTVLDFVLLRKNRTPIEKTRLLKRIGPSIQKVLYILRKPGDEVANEIINNIFKTNPSIVKELDKSYIWYKIHAFIRYKILEIFRTSFPPDKDYETSEKRRIAYYSVILMFIQNEELYSLNEEYNEILEKSIKINNNVLDSLNALAMDMYALSRIFKPYKPKTIQGQNQPEMSMNIIVYAGGEHIETYREFLLDDLYAEQLYDYQNPLLVSYQGSCVQMYK